MKSTSRHTTLPPQEAGPLTLEFAHGQTQKGFVSYFVEQRYRGALKLGVGTSLAGGNKRVAIDSVGGDSVVHVGGLQPTFELVTLYTPFFKQRALHDYFKEGNWCHRHLALAFGIGWLATDANFSELNIVNSLNVGLDIDFDGFSSIQIMGQLRRTERLAEGIETGQVVPTSDAGSLTREGLGIGIIVSLSFSAGVLQTALKPQGEMTMPYRFANHITALVGCAALAATLAACSPGDTHSPVVDIQPAEKNFKVIVGLSGTKPLVARSAQVTVDGITEAIDLDCATRGGDMDTGDSTSVSCETVVPAAALLGAGFEAPCEADPLEIRGTARIVASSEGGAGVVFEARFEEMFSADETSGVVDCRFALAGIAEATAEAGARSIGVVTMRDRTLTVVLTEENNCTDNLKGVLIGPFEGVRSPLGHQSFTLDAHMIAALDIDPTCLGDVSKGEGNMSDEDRELCSVDLEITPEYRCEPSGGAMDSNMGTQSDQVLTVRYTAEGRRERSGYGRPDRHGHGHGRRPRHGRGRYALNNGSDSFEAREAPAQLKKWGSLW